MLFSFLTISQTCSFNPYSKKIIARLLKVYKPELATMDLALKEGVVLSMISKVRLFD